MTTNQTDLILRLTRRNLFILLIGVLLICGTLLSNVFRPDAPFSRWPSTMPWLLPFAISIIFAATSIGGVRLNPKSAEVQAVLGDEWRQVNLTRAMRVAFFVVLIAQVPQAFLFLRLPVLRAVMGMAVATITVAMTTLITLFLMFDRDQSHE
jgi:hypothetical protein